MDQDLRQLVGFDITFCQNVIAISGLVDRFNITEMLGLGGSRVMRRQRRAGKNMRGFVTNRELIAGRTMSCQVN